jgi:hypothetical protein
MVPNMPVPASAGMLFTARSTVMQIRPTRAIRAFEGFSRFMVLLL